MPALDIVAVKLIVQDPSASSEELQQIIQRFAAELETKDGTVSFADVPSIECNGKVVPMGNQHSNILDIQINLDALKSFGRWLYDRLIGTQTEASFEYEGTKEARNNKLNNYQVA